MTTYYVVAVEENGDVLAIDASIVTRDGHAMTVVTSADGTCAYENQGDDAESKWESAKDALASIMPDDEDDDEPREPTDDQVYNGHGREGGIAYNTSEVCPVCGQYDNCGDCNHE